MAFFLIGYTFKFAGNLLEVASTVVGGNVGRLGNRLKGSSLSNLASQQRQDNLASLKAGTGIRFGRLTVPGSRTGLGVAVGRVATGDPLGHRALAQFNVARNNASKDLDSQGLNNMNASWMLLGGDEAFQAVLSNADTDWEKDQIRKVYSQLRRYQGDRAYMAAASETLAKMGLVELENRQTGQKRDIRQFIQRGFGDTVVGPELFNRAAVEARDNYPHLLFTNYRTGEINRTGLAKFMANKQQGDQAKFVADAFRAVFNDPKASAATRAEFRTETLTPLVAVPGNRAMQKSRDEILVELRRRFHDIATPQTERDYIEDALRRINETP
jgi:hypothetical protein